MPYLLGQSAVGYDVLHGQHHPFGPLSILLFGKQIHILLRGLKNGLNEQVHWLSLSSYIFWVIGSDPCSILFDVLLSYSTRWKEIQFTALSLKFFPL